MLEKLLGKGKKEGRVELVAAEPVAATATILKSPSPKRAPTVEAAAEILLERTGGRKSAIATSMPQAEDDLDIRSVLMQRLIRLLPELPADQHGELYDLTVAALELLAKDQVRAVREALANTLKDVAYAPLSVVKCLANDMEQTVAGPVLQLCATLTDSDLLEVIARQPRPWALAAIAARQKVSAKVASAIVDTGDVQAGSILLDNSGAVLEETTLASMVEKAADAAPVWQEKLAVRPHLPRQLALRLAEFVDVSIMRLLEGRRDFDPETIKEVSNVTRRRLTYLALMDGKGEPQDAAARLLAAGKLNDDLIIDAVSWNDRPFLYAGLAALAKIPVPTVESILTAQNARVITALSWKAGLSMRVALQLQMRIAGIAGRDVLNAKNGTAYPLSDDDMLWQLEYVGAIPHRRTG